MKKLYLVVLDTTEAANLRTVGRGILNTYVVYAEDEFAARKVVLKMFNQNVLEQVRSFLYVYDLVDVQKNLEEIDKNNGNPFFSFMPLNGQRPPRQSEIPNVSIVNGNQTLDKSVVPENQQVSPSQQPKQVVGTDPLQRVPVARTTRNVRSREFHEGDEGRPPVSDDLTPEQAQLVKRLGVTKNDVGADEGVNTRINASTGRNNNLSRKTELPSTPNTMPQNQADILAKLGIAAPVESQPDPEFDEDVVDSKTVFEDPSLAQVDGKPLTDEDIKRIQSELDGQK